MVSCSAVDEAFKSDRGTSSARAVLSREGGLASSGEEPEERKKSFRNEDTILRLRSALSDPTL